MTAISFVVHGAPAPQGSKRHVGRGIMVEANKNTRPWRAAVAAEAAQAMNGQPLITGPVWVTVTFTFTRPKAHYGTGGRASVLKATAPTWMASGVDLDKLCRAIGDALTGTVLRDDRQVAVWDAQKVYGESAKASVSVRECGLEAQ